MSFNKTFTVNTWDNIWEWGLQIGRMLSYRLPSGVIAWYAFNFITRTRQTLKSVVMPGNPNTPTPKAFNYMPDDVYANADYTRTREPIVNQRR